MLDTRANHRSLAGASPETPRSTSDRESEVLRESPVRLRGWHGGMSGREGVNDDYFSLGNLNRHNSGRERCEGSFSMFGPRLGAAKRRLALSGGHWMAALPGKSGFRKLEAPWRLSPRAAINPYRQIDRHLSILHRLINAYGATH